jgi:hypothetical protein
MNYNIDSLLKVFILFLLCVFSISCSKDSDLLAEYVLADTQSVLVRKYVVDDSFVMSQNNDIVLDVLSNDTFENQEEVIISETSSPTNGSVVINEDQTLTYTPETNEDTVDTFTYSTEVVNEDQTVSSETGTVNIKVTETSLKAFPAAYGGGSTVTGGRGGTLVIVNTLDFNAPLKYDALHDVYEGGLRAAFIDKIGARYIIFSVSGLIDGGNTEISINKGGDITVLGQSAPQGGVTLYRGWIDMNMSSNVIMRYLTIRSGVASGNPVIDDLVSSPFQIGNKNIIIDHCSASWGGDKGIIAGDWQYGFPLQNITVQNCLIADSATLGFSVDGKNGGAGDWDVAGKISWHYNFMTGGNRTPNLGGFDGLGVIQNNVVQSNGSKLSTIVHGNPKINHVGNYYFIHSNGIIPNRFQDKFINNATIYSKENYYENFKGIELNGVSGENNEKIWINTNGGKQLASSFFTEVINPSSIPNEPPLLSPQQAVIKVMSDVGAYKYIDNNGNPKSDRSEYDQIAINNFQNGILSFRKYVSDWTKPDVPQNTRPADYDTDKDGMADAWENKIIGNLNQSYNQDHDGDGYTNIEEFMNQVDY